MHRKKIKKMGLYVLIIFNSHLVWAILALENGFESISLFSFYGRVSGAIPVVFFVGGIVIIPLTCLRNIPWFNF